MKLRHAGAEDAERVARLHIASWCATYTRELPAKFLATQDLAERTAVWRDQIDHGVMILLAGDGVELSGFAACGPARHAGTETGLWEIYNLHVAPALHGQGIGSALFAAAAALGRDRGATILVLWVVETNAAARGFYERQGMQYEGGQLEYPVGRGQFLHEVRYLMKLMD